MPVPRGPRNSDGSDSTNSSRRSSPTISRSSSGSTTASSSSYQSNSSGNTKASNSTRGTNYMSSEKNQQFNERVLNQFIDAVIASMQPTARTSGNPLFKDQKPAPESKMDTIKKKVARDQDIVLLKRYFDEQIEEHLTRKESRVEVNLHEEEYNPNRVEAARNAARKKAGQAQTAATTLISFARGKVGMQEKEKVHNPSNVVIRPPRADKSVKNVALLVKSLHDDLKYHSVIDLTDEKTINKILSALNKKLSVITPNDLDNKDSKVKKAAKKLVKKVSNDIQHAKNHMEAAAKKVKAKAKKIAPKLSKRPKH